MRIENIGPYDIKVGDSMYGYGTVIAVPRCGLVVVESTDGFTRTFGWIDGGWRVNSNPELFIRDAYREVDAWVAVGDCVDKVESAGKKWVFSVRVEEDRHSPADLKFYRAFASHTTKWMAKQLNAGWEPDENAGDTR